MNKQEFYIPATDARLVVVQRIGRVLENLPMLRWRVEVSEAKPVRSNNQNRYLWGVVYPTIIQAGRLDGWEAQDIHEYLLGECFGWEMVEAFGRKRQRPLRRSSKLSKLEFLDFTRFIQNRMAEHGIYVPDPNE
jgi:hypothetical protein